MNPFTLTDDYFYPSEVQSLVSGDFDGDGKIDVIDIGINSYDNAQSGFGYLQGNGDGTFSREGVEDLRDDPRTFSLPGTAYSGAVGDFNKDGKLDLAVAFGSFNASRTENSGGVAILLGNGNGTFQAPSFIDISGSAAGLKAADLNGDGNLDLGVSWTTNVQNNGFLTLIGNGDGIFKAPDKSNGGSISAQFGNDQSFSLRDINNDGKVDLISQYAYFSNSIFTRLGLGDGTFSSEQKTIFATENLAGPIDVADFNGDGRMDIAAGTRGGVEVFLGQSDGTYSNPITSFQEVFPQRGKGFVNVVAKDMNGDGRADVLAADGGGGSYVGLSKGDGTFEFAALNENITNGFGFFTAILADDFNNDGRPDVISAPYTGRSFIHTQQPIPPTSLSIAGNTAATSEGSSGTTVFTFTVTRSGDLSGVSSATYTVGPTVSGATVSINDFGLDYWMAGSVSFAAGENTKTISVYVVGDNEIEADEKFSVRLGNPTGAALNVDTATATIVNDDGGTSEADNLITGPNGPFDIDLMAGDDRLTITGGSYRVLGNDGNDTISAASSRDAVMLFGGIGNDTLEGSTSNDTLDGGVGADRLVGGRGDDIYWVDNGGDQIIEGLGEGSETVLTTISYKIAATQEIETLRAADAASTNKLTLIGNEYANALVGNAGANTLDGGAGADVMTGLAGNDTYRIDNGRDRVIEAVGGGRDTVLTTISYKLADGQEIEVLLSADAASTGKMTLIGNAFAQTITGNAGANTLDGAAGADTLIGLQGNDVYRVDNGGDRVIEAVGGGGDTVLTTISYKLADGQEIEVLQAADAAGIGKMTLIGNAFAQTLTGNAGANTLDGAAGADVLIGLKGNDVYRIDNGGDRVVEAIGGGQDTVLAAISHALSAGQEIEILATQNDAGTAALNLFGNAFANTVRGNAGKNLINGKEGADVLTGGAGADTFVFDTKLGSGNVDRITDFAPEDTIRLSKAIFTELAAGQLKANEFKDIAKAGRDADDHILYDSRNGKLFYDVDGSGSAAAVQIAVLDNKAAITHADFLIA